MAGPGRIGGLLGSTRAGRPSPVRKEILAEPGREGAGTGGGRPGGRRGRGSGPGAMGAGFFRALSPHQGARQEIPPPSSLFLGRASVSPDAESVTRRGEERGIEGSGDRGLCPFCGRIGVREVELSPPACRSLAGPGPFQSREASCRDNHRPPLPSFLPKTLRLVPPTPGIGPGLLILSPRRREGLGRPGTGPEGARRGRKKRRARQSFLFPRPLSLLSLTAPPRESCFLPAVSAVILSKNPVQ